MGWKAGQGLGANNQVKPNMLLIVDMLHPTHMPTPAALPPLCVRACVVFCVGACEHSRARLCVHTIAQLPLPPLGPNLFAVMSSTTTVLLSSLIPHTACGGGACWERG